MFVLDRVKLLHATNDRFIPPDDFDLDEYMRDAFGVIRSDVEQVVIRFDPSLERYLKENIWHPTQTFKKEKTGLSRRSPNEGGSLLMTMEVGGLREVMSWVMGFGREAEVLEPAHLRQAVAQELTATTEKYVERHDDGHEVLTAEGNSFYKN
jgi:predicted DNA-binding transcriptional regulator YafY